MINRIHKMAFSYWAGIIVSGFLALTIASCSFPGSPNSQTGAETDLGWPKTHDTWHQTTQLEPGWERGKEFWSPTTYDMLRVPLGGVDGAQIVGQDAFCGECHSTYLRSFADNVHRTVRCEQCHGAASLHLETRGRQPNTILSLSNREIRTVSGKVLSAPERSEVCLQCHERGADGTATPCIAEHDWRTSSHAHREVACSDCHNVHYLIPPGTPPADDLVTGEAPRHSQFPLSAGQRPAADGAWAATTGRARQASNGPALLPFLSDVRPVSTGYQQPADEAALRALSRKLGATSPETCYRCHADMRRLEEVPHPHQLGVARVFNGRRVEFQCTTCHDAHGNVKAETRKDLCLQCHQDIHAQEWSGSPHDVGGVACADCHNPHPEAGPPMSVDEPGVCYRCHSEMRQLEQVAHPHQILGPNGFVCSTCHRPHGSIDSATRTDTCLKCHEGAPTMAWHSSSHSREGVACADCHNAHPEARVPQFVSVNHTSVNRSPRLPMCVDEPAVCFECHADIYGQISMPSHHPIKEGKMTCSDCHDGHGQSRGNLQADTLNDLCFKCHAEKEGPFVWEHAPVRENCATCHNPHGTVANNLLHQPTTFLCLRCHTGHSIHEFDGSNTCFRCHTSTPFSTDIGGGPRPPAEPTTALTRKALFTDCTQCHTQIHGTDLTRGFECGGGMRR